MTTYYDDNFGHYDIQSQDDIEFYMKVQKESVWKKCSRCKRKVKLRPEYSICNSCAEKIEKGMD